MAEWSDLETVGPELLLEIPDQQARRMYAPPGQDPGGMDGGEFFMKILKPGDPCPCCGEPIPEGLDPNRMLLLSWISEGIALYKAIKTVEALDHAQ